MVQNRQKQHNTKVEVNVVFDHPTRTLSHPTCVWSVVVVVVLSRQLATINRARAPHRPLTAQPSAAQRSATQRKPSQLPPPIYVTASQLGPEKVIQTLDYGFLQGNLSWLGGGSRVAQHGCLWTAAIYTG